MSGSSSQCEQLHSAPGNVGVGGAGRAEEEVRDAAAGQHKEAAQPEVEQPKINIGTIMRYILNLIEGEEAPNTPPNIVIGPDVPMDLQSHINTWDSSLIPIPDHQFVGVAGPSGLRVPLYICDETDGVLEGSVSTSSNSTYGNKVLSTGNSTSSIAGSRQR